MSLEAIKYGKNLSILNQLLLPSQSVYEELVTLEDAWNAVKSMKVGVALHNIRKACVCLFVF